MNHWVWHFLLHAVLGCVVAGVVLAVSTGTGGSVMVCFLWLAYPVGAWCIGWYLPRGAPGAALAVAVLGWWISREDAGPTAKSIATAALVFVVLGMVACEVIAPIVRARRAAVRSGSGSGLPD